MGGCHIHRCACRRRLHATICPFTRVPNPCPYRRAEGFSDWRAHELLSGIVNPSSPSPMTPHVRGDDGLWEGEQARVDGGFVGLDVESDRGQLSPRVFSTRPIQPGRAGARGFDLRDRPRARESSHLVDDLSPRHIDDDAPAPGVLETRMLGGVPLRWWGRKRALGRDPSYHVRPFPYMRAGAKI